MLGHKFTKSTAFRKKSRNIHNLSPQLNYYMPPFELKLKSNTNIVVQLIIYTHASNRTVNFFLIMSNQHTLTFNY